MKTNDDYQDRLPEHEVRKELPQHEAPLELESHVEEPAAAPPVPPVEAAAAPVAAAATGLGSLGWAGIAALAVIMFIGGLFIIYHRQSPADGSTATSGMAVTKGVNANKQPAIARVDGMKPQTQYAAVAAPQGDIVYLFPLDGSVVVDNPELNAAVARASEAGAYVTVTAYADKSGSASYNRRLSQRRAKAVADYLVAHGVAPDHIKSKAMGETDAYATNAQDRRVEIHFES